MSETTESPPSATIVGGQIVYQRQALETPGLVIEEVRGVGANGIVFGGRDTVLDRPIIAKLYFPARVGDPRDKRKQAIQEGRKLARLNHTNVVQVYSALGFDLGMLIVMERLEGPNLKEYLSQPRELNLRAQLWYDISDGLKYAHSEGVLHGDLHWKNVVVVTDKERRWGEYTPYEERAVLIDFGTSFFQEREGEARDREVEKPWELVKKLFAQDRILCPPKSSRGGMTPEESLFGCDQAVEMVKVRANVIHAFEGNVAYNHRRELFNLATTCSEFPYFPHKQVFQWIRENVPEDSHFYFFDHLEAYLISVVRGEPGVAGRRCRRRTGSG
jgi:serine/threonine protein kinase